MNEKDNEQLRKFKDAARELETNDDETSFDRVLKRVATSVESKLETDRKTAVQKRSRS